MEVKIEIKRNKKKKAHIKNKKHCRLVNKSIVMIQQKSLAFQDKLYQQEISLLT